MSGTTPNPPRGDSPAAKPRKLVTWRVLMIRKRLEYLGRVDAPDRQAAEAIAVTEFRLTDEQRTRLVLERA